MTDRAPFSLTMTFPRSPKRDVAKLVEYARKLGVEKKIRNYLEVLL